jgi:hypothetical protein
MLLPDKFVFVHVPKTGGTSIESALMEATLGAKLGDLAPEVADQYFIPRKGSKRQHSKLYDYENFGASIDSLFTFAFVRNPWDLVISEIFYFKTNKIPLFSAPDIKKNILMRPHNTCYLSPCECDVAAREVLHHAARLLLY